MKEKKLRHLHEVNDVQGGEARLLIAKTVKLMLEQGGSVGTVLVILNEGDGVEVVLKLQAVAYLTIVAKRATGEVTVEARVSDTYLGWRPLSALHRYFTCQLLFEVLLSLLACHSCFVGSHFGMRCGKARFVSSAQALITAAAASGSILMLACDCCRC